MHDFRASGVVLPLTYFFEFVEYFLFFDVSLKWLGTLSSLLLVLSYTWVYINENCGSPSGWIPGRGRPLLAILGRNSLPWKVNFIKLLGVLSVLPKWSITQWPVRNCEWAVDLFREIVSPKKICMVPTLFRLS